MSQPMSPPMRPSPGPGWGGAPWQLLHLAAVLALAGWCLLQAASAGVPLGWRLAWALQIALLAASPQWPVAGLVAYLGLAYGVSSHGELHDHLLAWRVLDGAVVLAGVGWCLHRRAQAAAPPWPWSAAAWLGLALLAWAMISLAAAQWRGAPWAAFPRHGPLALWHGALLFAVAADVLRAPRPALVLAGAVLLAVLVRAGLMGRDGLYLESYAATLAAIALPLAGAGAALTPHWAPRLLFGAAAAGMLGVLALGQNRAAAVALLAVVAAAGLMGLRWRPWRWPVLVGLGLLGLAVFAAAQLPLAQQYAARFRAVVDPTAQHQTAGADRGSVDSRLLKWRAGQAMAEAAPLLGVGPGQYPLELQFQVPGHRPMAAHSNYVHMLAETGVVGLALYLLFFLSLFWRLLRPGAPWSPVSPWLVLALVAYLAGGAFNSRHDLALAYLVAGWAVAATAARREQT